jgi:hypothetical protein
MEHGMDGNRGFGPVRKVTIRTSDKMGETELKVEYHMTEQKRITVTGRRDVCGGRNGDND